MKKEITIAYGKEIQLTTIGKKNKQVFLKFSPAFKNKQLKELKGASLSVFLCYALHSNDEGYCWIDSLLVEKETGYSKKAIIKARQFLKEKGYLFYERLYDEKRMLRDWIYRIFQPIEEKKEFIIRGIKLTPKCQKNRSRQKAEVGKNSPIIEQEPIILEEEPDCEASASPSPFSYKEKLQSMQASKQRHIQVIALYWKYKGIEPQNKEQYQALLKRELKMARNLAGFPDERITEVMDWLEKEETFKWGMETIFKYITENLKRIKAIK